MANFTSVKAGILTMIGTMTTANGFNYDWTAYNRDDINQPEDIYVVMDTPEGESNLDTELENAVGVNLYRNTREVQFYLYIKNPTGGEALDDVKESVEDLLELALDDFKSKFNSTYDDNLCNNDVIKMQYAGFEWVTAEDGLTKAGRYAPIRMRVLYEIVYEQSRGIS